MSFWTIALDAGIFIFGAFIGVGLGVSSYKKSYKVGYFNLRTKELYLKHPNGYDGGYVEFIDMDKVEGDKHNGTAISE